MISNTLTLKYLRIIGTGLLLLGLFLGVKSEVAAQDPGLIFKPAEGDGRLILNPSGDGYTSETTDGFQFNDVSESEINYHPMPQLAVEPLNDVRTGAGGGHTDLVDNGNQETAFMHYDGENLLFRIRIADQSTASKGYSFFFNTEFDLFGPQAENFTQNNPGFQFEVVLETNNGVRVYDFSDDPEDPDRVLDLDFDQHFQKSISYEHIGGEVGIFYDFYVPVADLESKISGFTVNSDFRAAMATITRAQSGITGTISDVNGLDDDAYRDPMQGIIDIVESFPPTSISDLDDGGGGFGEVVESTSIPSISTPVNEGSTSISGFINEEEGANIELRLNGSFEADATSTADYSWEMDNLTELEEGDELRVRGQFGSKDWSDWSSIVTVSAEGEPLETCIATGVSTATVTIDDTHQGGNIQAISGEMSGLDDAIDEYTDENIGFVVYKSGTDDFAEIYDNQGAQDPAVFQQPVLFSNADLNQDAGEDTWEWELESTTGNEGLAPDVSYEVVAYRVDAEEGYDEPVNGEEADCLGARSESFVEIDELTEPTYAPQFDETSYSEDDDQVSGEYTESDPAVDKLSFYQNGVNVRTIDTGLDPWSLEDLSLTQGEEIYAVAQDTNGLWTDRSEIIVIDAGEDEEEPEPSNPPVITGSYTTEAETIEGTTTEPAGTEIQLYLNGTEEADQIADISSSDTQGEWAVDISSVTLTNGDEIFATAQAPDKAESDPSDPVTIAEQSNPPNVSETNNDLTINSETIEVTSIDGGDGILRIYVDDSNIGEVEQSFGGSFTVDDTALGEDPGFINNELYRDAVVAATFQADGELESDFGASSVVVGFSSFSVDLVDGAEATYVAGEPFEVDIAARSDEDGEGAVFTDFENTATIYSDEVPFTAETQVTDPFTDGVTDPVHEANATEGNDNVVLRALYTDDPFITGQSEEFTILNPDEDVQLASIDPDEAYAGEGEVSITMTGENFVSSSEVRFYDEGESPGDNGNYEVIDGSNVVFINSGELQVTLPASNIENAGTHNITVYNPEPAGQVETDPETFTINEPPAPQLDEITPNTGGQFANLSVTITGVDGAEPNFIENITEVEFEHDIDVNNITFIDENNIEVDITINEAETNQKSVTISNPRSDADPNEDTLDFTVTESDFAGFEFDPIGIQQAGETFSVTIQAVSSDDSDYEGFDGSIELEASDGDVSIESGNDFTDGQATLDINVTQATDADDADLPDDIYLTATNADPDENQTGDSDTFEVNPGEAEEFIVTTDDQNPDVDSDIQLTAQLIDEWENPVGDEGLEVNWSDQADGGGTFSDGGTSNTDGDGIATITFTVASEDDTEHRIQASSNGISGLSPLITTVAVSPEQISLDGPADKQAGDRVEFTITTEDTDGNPLDASVDKIFDLSSDGTATFFEEDDPSTELSGNQVQIESGQNATSFWYENEEADSETNVTAEMNNDDSDASANDLGSDTATIDVQPGSIADFIVVLPGQTFTEADGLTDDPEAQTAGISFDIDLVAIDEFGNIATGYDGDQDLDFSGPGDAPDQTTPDFPETNISFTDGEAGPVSITLYDSEDTESLIVEDSGEGVDGESDSFDVSWADLAGFLWDLDSPQTNDEAFTGTNELTAVDEWENPVEDFDASADNVAISVEAPLDGNITGLSGGDELTSADDFGNGVADLTALGLTYTGTVATGDLVAEASGEQGAGQIEIEAGVPEQLSLAGPDNATAGDITSAYTLTVEDISGNTTQVGDETSFSLSSEGSATFYADDQVDTEITDVTLSGGESEGQFYYRNTDADTHTITATTQADPDDDGLDGEDVDHEVTVDPADADQLAFDAQPQTTTAGETMPAITMRVEDEFGNLVGDATDEVSVDFETDPSGGEATLSGTLAVNAADGIAEFDDLSIDVAEDGYSLQASADGLDAAASADFEITAGDPAQLSLDMPEPAEVTAGAVSDAITLTVLDSEGNPAPVSEATDFTLSSSSGGATTFDPASPVTIEDGNSSVTFTYSDEEAADQTVTAAFESGDSDLDGEDASHVITVEPGDADHFVISGETTMTAGETNDLTITARDEFANTATGFDGDQNIILDGASDAPDATGPVVSDKDGTEVAFGNPATLTFAEGVTGVSGENNGRITLFAAETANITATHTDTDPDIETSDALEVEVSAGDLNDFIWALNSPQTNAQAFTETNTITAVDSWQNVITDYDASANPVTISPTGDLSEGNISGLSGENDDELNLESDFTNGVADLTDSGVTYTGEAGSGNLQATHDGVTSSEALTIEAGEINQLAVSTQPEGGASGEELAVQPVIELQDISGNVVVSDSDTDVSVSIFSGDDGTLTGTTTVTADEGVVTYSDVTLAGTVGEDYVLRFSGGGEDVDSDIVNVTTGSAENMAMETQPGESTAGENIADAPAVIVTDGAGNPVENIEVTVSVNKEAFSSGTTSQTTGADGIAGFGDLQITVADTGYELEFDADAAGVANVTSDAFDVTPASNSVAGDGTVLSGSDLERVADGDEAATITVQLRDEYGNDVSQAGVEVAFSTDLGDLSTTDPVATNGSGLASVELTSTTTGTADVTAEITDPATGAVTNGSPVQVTFNAGALQNFLVEAEGGGTISEQTAGESFDIRITARDANNNTVTDFTGTVDISVNQNALQTGAGTTSAFTAGELSNHSLQINTADTGYEITATHTGETETGTSAGFDVVANTATQLAITTQPTGGTGSADGTATGVGDIILETRDAFDNPSTSGLAGEQNVTAALENDPSGEATLGGTKTLDIQSGAVTFSDLTLDQDGDGFTITLSSSSPVNLGDVTTDGFTMDQVQDASGFDVALAVAGDKTAGENFDLSITNGTDANGDDLDGSINVTITSDEEEPSEIFNGPVTFSDGDATIADVNLENATGHTLTIDVDEVSSDANLAVTIIAADADHFVITSQSGTEWTAGEQNQISITAYDEFENPATGYDGSEDVTFGGAAAINGNEPTAEGVDFGDPTSIVFTEGEATDIDVVLKAAETANLTVTDGTISEDEALQITVSAAAAQQLVINPTQESLTAGERQAFEVSREDAFGNEVSDDALTVNLSTPTDGTFYNADEAGDVITDVDIADGQSSTTVWYADTETTDSSYNITFDGGSGELTQTAEIQEVTSADAHKLVLIQEPSEVTSGAEFPEAQRPIVQLRDEFDNDVAEENVSVEVAIDQGDGSLTGITSAETNEDGQVEFVDLTITGTAGSNYVLEFTSTGLQPAQTSEFDVVTGLATPVIDTPDDGDFANIANAGDFPISGDAVGADEVVITVTDEDNNTLEFTLPVADDEFDGSIDLSENLDEGSLTITVVGVDEADNESDPAEVNIVLDLTPPVLTINEKLTNNNTPTITGTSDQPEGTTVTLVIDEETYTGEIDNDGNWSIDVTEELSPDGEFTAEVSIEDEAGNETTETETITIDTTPPAGYAVSWDTAPVNIGNEESGAFTISDGEEEATFDYEITSSGGGVPVTGAGTITDGNEQTVSGLDLSGLEDGELTITVTLTDEAWNEGTEATDQTDKNTVEPRLADIERHSPADELTNANELTFRVTFSEAVTGVDADDFAVSGVTGADIAVSVESSTVYDVTISGGDVADFDGIVALSLDSPDITDDFGNNLTDTGATGTVEDYTLDNTPPRITSIDLVGSPEDDDTSIQFVVNFDEDITGFNLEGFTLTQVSGDATGNLASFTQDDASTYTVTVDNLSGVGNIRLDFLHAEDDDIEDLAGNAIEEDFTGGDSHSVDLPGAPDSFTVADTSISQGEALLMDFSDLQDAQGNTVADGDYNIEVSDQLTGTAFTVENITFTDGEAENVEILDGDATADLDAVTYTDVVFEIGDGSDTADITVVQTLADRTGDSFTIGNITVSQGDQVEVTVSDITDLAGNDFDGEATITFSDLDHIDGFEGATKEFENETITGGSVTLTLFSGGETSGFAVQSDVALTAGIGDATETFNLSVTAVISADNSTVSVDPAEVIANGQSTSTITIGVRDEADDAITGLDDSAFELAFEAGGIESGTAGFGDFDDADQANGNYTFTITNSAVETGDVVVEVSGTELASQPEIVFTAQVADADLSGVSADPTTGITADGTDHSEITIEVRDADDVAISELAYSDFTISGLSEAEVDEGSFSEDGSTGNYTVNVTNTDAETIDVSVEVDGQTLGNSGDITFVPGIANSITLSGSTDDLSSGDSRTLSIELFDAYDNLITTGSDSNLTITFAKDSGDGTVDGLGDVNAEEGEAEISLEAVLAGSITISASAENDAGTTISDDITFTIVPGEATQLAFEQQPTETVAGESISPAVTISLRDANDNLVEDSGTDIDLSITGATSATLSGTTTQATDAGIATFADLNIDEVGSYTLTAESGQLDSEESDSFDITAGTPHEILITQQPLETVAGQSVAGAPEVRVRDDQGNNLEDVEVSVSLSSDSFTGSSITEVDTDADGLAEFSNLIIETADEDYSLTFNVSGVTGLESAEFDVLPAAVDPANAGTILEVTEDYQTADGSEEASVRVTLLDGFDNPVPDVVVAFNTTGDAEFTNSTESGSTNADGQFSATLTNNTAEQVDVSVLYDDDGDGTADAGGINDSPIAVTFTSGDAENLVIESGNNQTGTVDQKLGDPLVVKLTDSEGNPVQNESVSFSITDAPEDAINQELQNESTTTDADGLATAELRLGTLTGAYEVTVSSAGLTDVEFIATAESGTADQYLLTFSEETPTAGDAITVTARLADEYGNPVEDEGREIDWSATNGGSFSDEQDTDASGEATVTFTTNTTAGTEHEITATDNADGSINGSGTVTTSGGDATQLVITLPGETFEAGTGNTASPEDQQAGSAFDIEIRATDANFNVDSEFDGSTDLDWSGLADAPNGQSPDVPASVNFNDGVATAVSITAYLAGEDVQMTASEQGGISGVASSEFDITSGDLSEFVWDLTSPQINAEDFTDTNTLTVRDEWENVLSGFDASANNVEISTLGDIDDGDISGLSGTTTLNSADDFENGVADLTDLGIRYTGPAGNGELRAASGGVQNDTALEIQPGAATQISLNGPGSVVAGSVSDAFTVTILDVSGNTTTDNTARTLDLSSDNLGSATFFSDDAGNSEITELTIAEETSTGTFYFSNNEVEDETTVTATDQDGFGLGSASHDVDVTDTGASQIALLGLADDMEAGTSTSFTLQIQDGENNPVPGASDVIVNLSSDQTDGLFFIGEKSHDDDLSGDIDDITITQGDNDIEIWYYATSADNHELSIADDASTLTGDSDEITVLPASLDDFVIAANEDGDDIGDQTAGDEFTIELTAIDAFENTVTGFNDSFNLTVNNSNFVTGFDDDFGDFENGSKSVTLNLRNANDQVSIAVTGGGESETSNEFEVNRRPIAIEAAAASKTYGDDDPDLPFELAAGSDLIPGDTELQGALSREAGDNVGTYAIRQGSVTNAENANYDITFTGDDFDITTRDLTLSNFKVDDKTFDGTTDYTGDVNFDDDRVAGDELEFDFDAVYSSADAGAVDVEISDITISGGSDQNNYNLVTTEATEAATINKAEPVISTWPAATDITYGETLAESGLSGGDSDVTGTFTFADATIQPDAAGDFDADVTFTPDDGDNYETVAGSEVTTVTVMPKELTVINAEAQDKIYDGNTEAEIESAELSGIIGSDDVELTNATTGELAQSDVGTSIAVTTNFGLGGDDAGNYTISQPTGLSADISPAQLTVINAEAQDKVYDGDDAAQITGAQLDGVVNGETVNLDDADEGTFDDANAGTGVAVSTNMSISGSDAGNYELVQPTGLSADITPAHLTVINAEAQDKTYDGNTDAEIEGAELSGVIGSDDVELTNATTGEFAQSDVGTSIAVTTNFGLGGDDAGNYMISQPTGLSANINPAALTITVNDAEREAGAADPAFSFEDFSAALAGLDVISDVTGGTGSADDVDFTLETTDENSSTGVYADEIGIDVTSLDGSKEGNYDISIVLGTLTITPAELASFEVSGISDPTTAGDENSVTVRAVDTEGNTKTDYTGTVTFSSSDAEADLPADYTFTTGDEGAVTLTDTVILKTAGDHWVEAADGDENGRQEDITVQSADAHTIVVSEDISNQTAGTGFDVDFTIQDAFENTVTGFIGQVDLSVEFGAVSPAEFEFVASDEGSKTVSLTLDESGEDQKISGELESEATVNGESNEFDVTAGVISATNSSVTVDPSELVVGNNSTVTITVRDSNENLIGDLGENDVTLDLSGDAGIVAGTFEESSEGVYEIDITNETAEEITVTATVSGTQLNDEPTVEFTVGDVYADNSEISANPDELTVGDNSTITVTLADKFENPVSGITDFNVDLDGATEVVAISETGQAGTYELEITNTTAETNTISVEANSTSIGSVDVTFTVDAISASESSVSVDPAQLEVTNNSTVTITLRDGENNLIGGVAETDFDLELTGSASEVTDSFEETTTGVYELQVTNTVTEEITVTVTADGTELDNKPTITFTSGAISADNSSVTVDPDELEVTNTSTVTITLRDGENNLIGGVAEADFDLDLTGNAGEVAESFEETSEGVYTIDVTNEAAEEITVTVTADGTKLNDNPTITFTSGAISAANSSVTATSPHTADGSDASKVTIVLKDGNENPVGGVENNITLSGLGEATAGSIGETGDTGTYEVELTNTTAEEITITVTADGTELNNNPTITFKAGDAHQLAFVEQPSDAIAGQVIEPAVTVKILDEYGNMVTYNDRDIELSISDGAKLQGNHAMSSDGDIAEFDALSVMNAGTGYTLTAEASGLEPDESDPFNITAGAISADKSTVIANPVELKAGQYTTIQVTLSDEYENVIAGLDEDQFDLTFNTPDASVVDGSFAETEDGVYEFEVTNKVAEVVKVTVEASSETLNDQPEVTFTPGDVHAGNSSVTARPVEVVVGDESEISVNLYDTYENRISGADVSDFEIGLSGSAEMSSSIMEDGSSGEYVFAITNEEVEKVTVQVTANGMELDDKPKVSFITDEISALKSVVSADPQELYINESSTVSVGLRDSRGNLIEGLDADDFIIELTGEAEIANPIAESDTGGSYEFEITSEYADTISVTITAKGTELDDQPEIYFLHDFETLVMSSGDGQQGPTRTTLEEELKIQLLNSNDHPVPGMKVIFSVQDTPVGSEHYKLTNEKIATDEDGHAATEFILGDRAGNYQVEAKVEGAGLDPVKFHLEAVAGAPEPGLVDSVNTVVFEGLPDAYIFTEEDSSLEFDGSFSFETWLLPFSTDSDGGEIISNWHLTNEEDRRFRFDMFNNTAQLTVNLEEDEAVRVVVEDFFDRTDKSETNSRLSSGDQEESAYSWTHLAIVVDSDDGRIDLYKNGFREASAEFDGTVPVSDQPVEMGRGFDGEVHEVRYWDRALTRSEVQGYKDFILSGDAEGLRLYHLFDEYDEDNDYALDATNLANHFYLSDEVKRNFRQRNITELTMYQDEESILTLTGASQTGSAITSSVIETPENGTLFQVDESFNPQEQISGNATTLKDSGNRVLYIPNEDFVGTDSVRFELSDEFGNVAEGTQVINVLEVNKAPILAAPKLLEFKQRDTLRVGLDSLVTDNFYQPDEMKWKVTGIGNGVLKDGEERWQRSANDSLIVLMDEVNRELVLTTTEGYLGEEVPVGLQVTDQEGLFDEGYFLTTVENIPPSSVSLIKPAAGEKLKSNEITFTWSRPGNAGNQQITYDLYIERKDGETLVKEGLSDTTYTISNAGYFLRDHKYEWRVVASDGVDATLSTNINNFEIVLWYSLAQNYPNPFNPTTSITYMIPEQSEVRITIYDVLGRQVARLVDESEHQPGNYTVEWDASSLASGTYIYRLEAISLDDEHRFVNTKTMTLIK